MKTEDFIAPPLAAHNVPVPGRSQQGIAVVEHSRAARAHEDDLPMVLEAGYA